MILPGSWQGVYSYLVQRTGRLSGQADRRRKVLEHLKARLEEISEVLGREKHAGDLP